MASASSRIISLKPVLKIVLVLAKLKICPRTMPIPRSSDAFSSKTWKRKGMLNNKDMRNLRGNEDHITTLILSKRTMW
jgi:hypothetical protein